MTYREQVLAAIAHKETGAIPIDLGGTTSSSMSATAYSNLLRHLGKTGGKTRVHDVVQQVVQPSDDILDLFKIGVVDVGRSFNTADGDWRDFTLPNGAVVQYPKDFRTEKQDDGSYRAFSPSGEYVAVMPAGAAFYDQTVYPYLDGFPSSFKNLSADLRRVSWNAFALSPFDHADEPGFWAELRARALQLRETSGRALLLTAGCSLFEAGTVMRRIDNFLMDLVLDPETVEKFLDALMERYLERLGKICGSVGDVVDIVRISDDLGTDTGPFMSPETYRTLFKPRVRALCDFIKKHSTMATFQHSCGSIRMLLPDIIDAGVQIINPVQTMCRDMEPDRLKKEFGKDVVFWGGGVNTRWILNRGTPDQVRDDVRRNVETLAPGGGFVFAAIHNIMGDVPPENILAMYETVHGYRE